MGFRVAISAAFSFNLMVYPGCPSKTYIQSHIIPSNSRIMQDDGFVPSGSAF